MQHEGPGVDDRGFQQVVDQALQVQARALDQLQPAQRGRVARFQVHQPRQPQDAVQRRAQLVAHLGQEAVALGAALARQLQRGVFLGHQLVGLLAQQQAHGQALRGGARGGQQQRQQQQLAAGSEVGDVVAAHRQAPGHGQQHRHHVGGGGGQPHLQAEGGDAAHAVECRHAQCRQRHVFARQAPAGQAPDQAVEREHAEHGAFPALALRAGVAPAHVGLRQHDARQRHRELGRQPALHQQRRQAVLHLQRQQHGKGRGGQRAEAGVQQHHAQLLACHVFALWCAQAHADLACRAFQRQVAPPTLLFRQTMLLRAPHRVGAGSGATAPGLPLQG